MPDIAVFAHYEVLPREDGSPCELGRGALGVTYKAFDRMLRIPVALKVIDPAFLRSAAARERFARVTSAAAQLLHRHVAAIFYFGSEGDTSFYVMEFVHGESVQSLVERRGSLHPVLALTIAGQVAQVFVAAAQQGLVHRDIKPGNIMLVQEDDETIAKVLDFGMAAATIDDGEGTPEAKSGNFIGTPHFGSPEQLMEKPIDIRSDFYSLGVTLWYMLAGQPPFTGAIARVMSQHFSSPPPFEELANTPPPVVDLLRKMLAKAPEDRHQTPAELRKAIEAALEKITGGSGTSERGADPATAKEVSTVRDQAPADHFDAAPPQIFDDDVRFTIYRPQAMSPESWEVWLAFAHRGSDGVDQPDYAAEVESQARAILGANFGEGLPRRQESGAALLRERTITIVPAVNGLEFNPPQRSFTWQEPVHRVEFLARASSDRIGATLRGKIMFFLGALIVAEINIRVAVTASAQPAVETTLVPDCGKPYRHIYASYSRKDVDIVEHFERIVSAFGDRYLRDLYTLRANEEWSPGLERLIREADIFQLFWSQNSMRSRHVRQEWNFALGLGRPNFLRPTYWETPFPKDDLGNLPPPDLRRLHFHPLPMEFSKTEVPPQVWTGAARPVARPSTRAIAPTEGMDDTPPPSNHSPSSAGSRGASASAVRRRKKAVSHRWQLVLASACVLLLAGALVAALLKLDRSEKKLVEATHPPEIAPATPIPVKKPKKSTPQIPQVARQSSPPALPMPGPMPMPMPMPMPVSGPTPIIASFDPHDAVTTESERKAVKAEVLTRIEYMKISTINKDKLYSAVDKAREMRKLLIIPFDFAKADLGADSLEQLESALRQPEIKKWRADPTAVFIILGYADLRGTVEANKYFSQKRADVVRDALRDKCEVFNIMHSFGMGGTKLLDAQNLEKNRITEVWVVLP